MQLSYYSYIIYIYKLIEGLFFTVYNKKNDSSCKYICIGAQIFKIHYKSKLTLDPVWTVYQVEISLTQFQLNPPKKTRFKYLVQKCTVGLALKVRGTGNSNPQITRVDPTRGPHHEARVRLPFSQDSVSRPSPRGMPTLEFTKKV